MTSQKPHKSSAVYLTQIQERLQRLDRQFEHGREHFLASEDAQDAAIRNLEIIGEIVKRLPRDLTDLRPEIPWKQIAGFRDVAIHNYDDLIIKDVWKILEHDLRPLREAVNAMHSALTASGDSDTGSP
jgi:uncharacterized protein with HEPN domain